MKCILTIFFCSLMTACFAETIGTVEYHLPQAAEEWQVANKLENEKGTTLVYIPKGSQRETTKEFFGVNTNTHPTDVNDTTSFKTYLMKAHPGKEIEVSVLEKSNDSVLVEWSAKEEGHTKLYGLNRVFSTQDGTVVLGYQTENTHECASAKAIWCPALKAASNKTVVLKENVDQEKSAVSVFGEGEVSR